MEPRLSLITLGVRKMAESRAYYERLGWRLSGASQDGVAFFQLGGVVLALYGRDDLARDAGLQANDSGMPPVTLAQNVRSIAAVETAFEEAVAAGATALKPPHTAPWGGRVAYVADPDGFVWEFAYNPGFPLDGAGNVVLPP